MFSHVSRKYSRLSMVRRITTSQLPSDYIHICRTHSTTCGSHRWKSYPVLERQPGSHSSPFLCCRHLNHVSTPIRPYTQCCIEYTQWTQRNTAMFTGVSRGNSEIHMLIHRSRRFLVRTYSSIGDEKIAKGWSNDVEKQEGNGSESTEDSGYHSDMSEMSSSSSESSSSDSESSDSDNESMSREEVIHKVMSDIQNAEVLGMTRDELLKICRLSNESDYDRSGIDISDFENTDDTSETLDTHIESEYVMVDEHLGDEESEPLRQRNISSNAKIYKDDLDYQDNGETTANQTVNVVNEAAGTKLNLDSKITQDSDNSIIHHKSTDVEASAFGKDDIGTSVDHVIPGGVKAAPQVPEIEIEDFVNLPEEAEIEEKWQPPVPLTRGKEGVYSLDDLVTLLHSVNAVDIVAIKIPAHIDFADYMVIVSAKSYRHMKAIATDVKLVYKAKKHHGDKYFRVEGIESSKDWFAMDLGNIILHIFMPETRELYDLETLWTVGPQFDEKCNEAADPYVFSVDQLPWLEELENQSEETTNIATNQKQDQDISQSDGK